MIALCFAKCADSFYNNEQQQLGSYLSGRFIQFVCTTVSRVFGHFSYLLTHSQKMLWLPVFNTGHQVVRTFYAYLVVVFDWENRCRLIRHGFHEMQVPQVVTQCSQTGFSIAIIDDSPRFIAVFNTAIPSTPNGSVTSVKLATATSCDASYLCCAQSKTYLIMSDSRNF